MNDTLHLPKYYVWSGELSCIVLAVEPRHAAARLIEMLWAGNLLGRFERTVNVSESGRADDAVEFDSLELFWILGLLPLELPRDVFDRFFFSDQE